jgi:hypothetical protein
MRFVFVRDAIAQPGWRAIKTFVRSRRTTSPCFGPTSFVKRTSRSAQTAHHVDVSHLLARECDIGSTSNSPSDDRRRRCAHTPRWTSFGAFSRATWKRLPIAAGFSVKHVSDSQREDFLRRDTTRLT